MSGFDPTKGSAAVRRIEIASSESTYFPTDDSFAGFEEPAGMHRAREADIYAWIEGSFEGGSVYILK